MDNLSVWKKVSKTPPVFLREITSGNLKGKHDINPQWRLMAMTQAFGMVGHGWTYRIVRTWSEQSTALAKDKKSPDPTMMVFVEVAVKTKINGEWGEEFYGIGGSQIVQQFNNYSSANDEGYKMALTDALSVAFKAVGVAADIYFGNFDGSKYNRDITQAFDVIISQEQHDELATIISNLSPNSRQAAIDAMSQRQVTLENMLEQHFSGWKQYLLSLEQVEK